MAGIVSFGVHVPRWKISTKCINQAWSISGGKGERSVANFDEDSITMAVSSGLSCLENAGCAESDVEGLYFATTTPPYKEKSSATVISVALDLRSDIRIADYCTSLRASTIALMGAIDSVNSNSAKNILVAGADCRLAKPGSTLEAGFGDASASILVGNDNVIADVIETYSVCNDIFDLWRRDEDVYVRQDDVRFAQIYGYEKSVRDAVEGILKRAALKPSDFARVIFTPSDRRTHLKVVSKLGFDAKSQLQDSLMVKVGLCGAAYPLLLLSSSLEDAKPGDKILLVSYGDGADAFIFQVTDGIAKLKDRRQVAREIETRRELTSYNKYLSLNNLIKGQEPSTAQFSSSSLVYREQDSNIRLYGRVCQKCKKSVFLKDIHVCPNCYARDPYKPIKLSKEAVLFTFNQEYYYPSPDPPTTMAIIDFPEKVRITTQMTDTNAEDVKVDMPVEMCFRKYHDGHYFHNYFWKCRPKN